MWQGMACCGVLLRNSRSEGIFRNCSITPGNSAWIAERVGFRRYDFVDNAEHYQVIPTNVGIQMFFFGVRPPSLIEQLQFSVMIAGSMPVAYGKQPRNERELTIRFMPNMIAS